MKKQLFIVFFAAILIFVSCKVADDTVTSPDSVTITLSGTVTDSSSSSPIEFAVVRIIDGTTELTAATTNSSGVFSTSIEISEDQILTLSVLKDGYSSLSSSFTVTTSSTSESFSIKLLPLTTSIDSVLVSGSVIDSKSGDLLSDTEVRFYSNYIALATAKTDLSGNFTTKFPLTGTKELQVISVKASYLADTTSIVAVAGQSTNMPTIKMRPLLEAIAGEPASIFIVSQTIDAIGVTESGSPETAKIVFEVQDSSGIPIDLDHAVYVNFRFGASPGGGEILAPGTVKTNDVGQVAVNLTSGTISGAVQIIAEIDYNGDKITSKPVGIAIHGGLPDLAHFSVGTNQRNYAYYHILAGLVNVTSLVGDKYTNPVKPSTVVYFSSDAAVVQGSGLTDNSGVASVTLLSGNPLPNDPTYGPGFFYIHARTINENEQSITTNTRVLFSGTPVITISPTTFNVANGGSQSFTYTVTDQFGNPLAPGNNYSVSVSTAGEAGVAGDVAINMPDVQVGNTSFSFVLTDDNVDETKLSPATVIISVDGPNGRASLSVAGTVQ
jgi:hypothetical protein